MGHQSGPARTELDDTRDRLVAVMKGLRLPSPERMLGRIERMLPERDRERVLGQLLADFQQQSRDEVRQILKVLAPDRDEWVREVDRMLQDYHPV
jgi:hypothetical protein